eukprot:TRINITY_DN7198_c0_g1_i1.p1 TRINITY_DN7198_c0_g1~~TRINITY_DN7198_c0_g1_i1.p1  ORF type:complete len:481 (+),score=142.10 TRINITY_DN7198_c0_g1_i1:80-1522(+)
MSSFSNVLILVVACIWVIGVHVYNAKIVDDLQSRLKKAEQRRTTRDDGDALYAPPGRTLSPLHTTKEEFLYKWLDDYIVFHGKITSGQLPPRYAKCSFANGYGNCWQQFVSCVLYAMMSERALILVRRSNEPFNPFMNHLDDMYLPPPVTMWRSGNISELESPVYGPPIDTPETWPWYTSLIETVPSCGNVSEVHGKIDYLGLSGGEGFDYFADKLRENPRHGLLHKLPSNFYQIIFNYFLKLRPHWQAIVDDFKAKHFGKYTIGLQMRGHDNHGRHGLVPLDIFMQAAEIIAADCPVPFEDVVFYVASPDRQAVIDAQAMYGRHKIVFYEGNGTLERNSGAGDLHSVITMWLLGECDDVITSELSSFGTNSAARGGIVPVVCNHERSCMRRLTPQPCTYLPYPILHEFCVANLSTTFHRYSTVEGHCTTMFRAVEDCSRVGCRDQYNSFKFKLPKWLACAEQRPGPREPSGVEHTQPHC